MRDGFIFYRSFFESFSDLSKRDKLTLFDALCNYALNDVEPELSGAPSAVFKLLKPQVDANNRRYENGRKGGRPRTNQSETEEKPNDNQNITKAERKEKEKQQLQLKDKQKEKVNVKEQLQPQEKELGCGSGSDNDNSFDLWSKLTPKMQDQLKSVYPNSWGYLVDDVAADVKQKQKTVKDPVAYILGYAKNVAWNDDAEHFTPPWEVIQGGKP